MIYIGVDPGKKGGYAVIDGNDVEVYAWDDALFVDTMRVCMGRGRSRNERVFAAVEKVGAMPGQGTVSMFSFGQSFGFILGVLAALDISFQLVPPRKWKAEFSLTNDKGKSIETCKRLFPNVSLLPTERCRKDSDGMAESLLIAEYARRKM